MVPAREDSSSVASFMVSRRSGWIVGLVRPADMERVCYEVAAAGGYRLPSALDIGTGRIPETRYR